MPCKQIVFSLNIYYGYFCKIHVLKKKKLRCWGGETRILLPEYVLMFQDDDKFNVFLSRDVSMFQGHEVNSI